MYFQALAMLEKARLLLKHTDGTFTKPIKAIYYCYSVDQPLCAEIKRDIPNMTFFDGLPTWSDLEHKVLVTDDHMSECSNDKSMSQVFCKLAHHFRFYCLLISQNAFCPGREFRTISLNTHYFFLFKNGRDELQIQTLGRQIFPG